MLRRRIVCRLLIGNKNYTQTSYQGHIGLIFLLSLKADIAILKCQKEIRQTDILHDNMSNSVGT